MKNVVRKWYFCISETSLNREDHGWTDLIKVAVISAIKNTTLIPVLIYDGQPNELTNWLEECGVQIINHRVGIYQHLQKRDAEQPGYLAIASGAFLRIDIPLVETEEDYVLYTDCDVLFLKEIEFGDQLPEYFACAPQTSKVDYDNDANSGVMVINVANMRKDHKEFSNFIIKNLYEGWPGCDQENYRNFYRGRWSKLPIAMNWKPYWGDSDDEISILHWHGPKPDGIQKKIQISSYDLYKEWELLYQVNSQSYFKFYEIWSSYLPIEYPQKIIGHSDFIDDGFLVGWLLYENQTNRVLDFSLYSDGIFLGKFKNNLYRADLQRLYGAFIGGFEVKLVSPINSDSIFDINDEVGNSAQLSLKIISN